MKKILVRVPQWLGDAVVSTIFLERLKAKFPSDDITVLSPPYLKTIFETHPSVRDVLTLPYAAGGTTFSVGRMLKERQFDTVYVLPRSFRTAWEAWLSGIPERIGFGGDLRRLFFTQSISYKSNLAYPHRYLRLIGEDNLNIEGLRPYFPQGKPVNKFENLPGPLLGLAPASVAPSRTWNVDGFAAVANQFLMEKKGTVVLFGSAREQTVTAQLKQKIHGSVVDTAGKLDLPSLGWMMSQLNALVANDSGLMHVASACNVPTVVLFGASEPEWATPRVGSFQTIQHREISCVPCLRNQCVRWGRFHNACLNAITSEEVNAALKKLI